MARKEITLTIAQPNETGGSLRSVIDFNPGFNSPDLDLSERLLLDSLVNAVDMSTREPEIGFDVLQFAAEIGLSESVVHVILAKLSRFGYVEGVQMGHTRYAVTGVKVRLTPVNADPVVADETYAPSVETAEKISSILAAPKTHYSVGEVRDQIRQAGSNLSVLAGTSNELELTAEQAAYWLNKSKENIGG